MKRLTVEYVNRLYINHAHTSNREENSYDSFYRRFNPSSPMYKRPWLVVGKNINLNGYDSIFATKDAGWGKFFQDNNSAWRLK